MTETDANKYRAVDEEGAWEIVVPAAVCARIEAEKDRLTELVATLPAERQTLPKQVDSLKGLITCPYCNDKRRYLSNSGGTASFRCGTSITRYAADSRHLQSTHCCQRERANLERQLAEARRERDALWEALKDMKRTEPANHNGDLFYPRYTQDGDYAGEEPVDPLALLSQLYSMIYHALVSVKAAGKEDA